MREGMGAALVAVGGAAVVGVAVWAGRRYGRFGAVTWQSPETPSPAKRTGQEWFGVGIDWEEDPKGAAALEYLKKVNFLNPDDPANISEVLKDLAGALRLWSSKPQGTFSHISIKPITAIRAITAGQSSGAGGGPKEVSLLAGKLPYDEKIANPKKSWPQIHRELYPGGKPKLPGMKANARAYAIAIKKPWPIPGDKDPT